MRYPHAPFPSLAQLCPNDDRIARVTCFACNRSVIELPHVRFALRVTIELLCLCNRTNSVESCSTLDI